MWPSQTLVSLFTCCRDLTEALYVQIEIKLRLKDAAAHQRVAEALEPHLITTHKQENIFFDGLDNELSNQRTIVRTRFYNTNERCLLTIKVGRMYPSFPSPMFAQR